LKKKNSLEDPKPQEKAYWLWKVNFATRKKLRPPDGGTAGSGKKEAGEKKLLKTGKKDCGMTLRARHTQATRKREVE